MDKSKLKRIIRLINELSRNIDDSYYEILAEKWFCVKYLEEELQKEENIERQHLTKEC